MESTYSPQQIIPLAVYAFLRYRDNGVTKDHLEQAIRAHARLLPWVQEWHGPGYTVYIDHYGSIRFETKVEAMNGRCPKCRREAYSSAVVLDIHKDSTGKIQVYGCFCGTVFKAEFNRTVSPGSSGYRYNPQPA